MSCKTHTHTRTHRADGAERQITPHNCVVVSGECMDGYTACLCVCVCVYVGDIVDLLTRWCALRKIADTVPKEAVCGTAGWMSAPKATRTHSCLHAFNISKHVSCMCINNGPAHRSIIESVGACARAYRLHTEHFTPILYHHHRFALCRPTTVCL